jgi:hypothetical protein
MISFSAAEIESRFPDGTIWRDRQGRVTVMLADGRLLAGEELEREMRAAAAPAAAAAAAPTASCGRCTEFEQALAEHRAQISHLGAELQRLEGLVQSLLKR